MMSGDSLQSLGNFLVKLLALVAVVVLLVVYSAWAANTNAADEKIRQSMDQIKQAASRGPYTCADGVYEGSAKGYGGTVTIKVTMANGYIKKVECTDHSHEDAQWWTMAKVLLDTIREKQSTNVDVISNATYSSAGIINATKKAIESGTGASK